MGGGLSHSELYAVIATLATFAEVFEIFDDRIVVGGSIRLDDDLDLILEI